MFYDVAVYDNTYTCMYLSGVDAPSANAGICACIDTHAFPRRLSSVISQNNNTAHASFNGHVSTSRDPTSARAERTTVFS